MALELLPAGLIDLDLTFLVQLGLFLIFAGLARLLAFGPLLRLFQQRRQQGPGAMEEAAQATVRAGRLEEAKQESLALRARELAARTKARREELARQGAVSLLHQKEELAGRLAVQRAELARVEEALAPELQQSAKGLAAELASRLLGRS